MLRYEEKYFALKNYFENDLSIKDIATTVCVGESTVRDWLKKIDYDFNNIERLKRKKPDPLEFKRPVFVDLPEWVKKEILALIKKSPQMGALKLKQYFFRHHQVVLSEKKIYLFLKEKGIIANRTKRSPKEHNRRFEYPYPLAAVQVDLLTVELTNKSKIYLVTFLDDYSRYILLSQFISTKTMEEVMRLLMATVKKHGVMEIIICDRGSEFVSWQSVTDFEELLCKLDIELISSGPDTPQNQGKIERWHQTYRQECELSNSGFTLKSEAQLETDNFVAYYNYERPHQGIGGLIPADRYYGLSLEIEQELKSYSNGNRENERIYFSCNINGKKMVVSGPRNGELGVYQNIKESKDD